MILLEVMLDLIFIKVLEKGPALPSKMGSEISSKYFGMRLIMIVYPYCPCTLNIDHQ